MKSSVFLMKVNAFTKTTIESLAIFLATRHFVGENIDYSEFVSIHMFAAHITYHVSGN